MPLAEVIALRDTLVRLTAALNTPTDPDADRASADRKR